MKHIYFLVIFFGSALFIKAQDPTFLNSNQTLVNLNPSFAGSNGGIRHQFSYRDQWPNLSTGMNTCLNSFDAYLKPLHAGIAVSWMNDNVFDGLVKSNVFSLTYSQYFSLLKGNLKIIPSLQVSYGKRSGNYVSSGYFFMYEPIDPRYGSVWGTSYDLSPEKSYVDFSSGLLISFKNKFYLGASFFHMNQPDIGLSGAGKLPYSINLHSSYNFKLSEKSYLQAFYLLNTQNQFFTNRIALNLITFNHIISGLALNNWDSPILSAGYRNNYFSVLLGYDFTLNKLAGNTTNAWELHASFNLRNKELRKSLTSFETW